MTLPAPRPNREALLVFLGLALLFGWFRHDAYSNGDSRLGLVFAAADEGRLTIDSYHTTTVDKAFHDGHWYSDKAIGTSLLGFLVYLPLRLVTSLLGVELALATTKWILTFLAVGLPGAAAGGALYLVAREITGNPRAALLVTAGIAIGTLTFPYATLFYGHVLAGACLFAALALARARGAGFLIGLLLGMAVLTEYPCAVAALAIGVYSLRGRRGTAILGAAAGAAIPAAILFIYDTICFGGPFSIGYQHLALDYFHEAMGQGLMGVGWPRADVLFYLTLHPGFGLFWQSPVLLLALPGLAFMLRDPAHRGEGLAILAAFAGTLLVNSGYYMWWGGYSIGPRHLIPVLPLLGVPLAHAARRVPWPWLALLVAAGVFQMTIVTTTDPQMADDVTKRLGELPLFGFSTIYSLCWPRILAGRLAATLATLLGLLGGGVWWAGRRA